MEKYFRKFTELAAEFDEIKSSKAYQLRQKICNGEKLTREEKNWLTEKMNDCCYMQDGCIPVLGWFIDFTDIAKRYLIQFENAPRIWHEKYAVDKTSLRLRYKHWYPIKTILEYEKI